MIISRNVILMKWLFLILPIIFGACSRNMVVSEDEVGAEIFYAGDSYKPYTGKCTVLYRDSDRVKSAYTFRNGRLNGESATWFLNGQVKRKGHYRDGQLTGTWVFWNEQGKKIMEANYNSNDLDGSYTSLYQNGKIRESGTFSNKKQVGKWEFYNENGKIIQVISK